MSSPRTSWKQQAWRRPLEVNRKWKLTEGKRHNNVLGAAGASASDSELEELEELDAALTTFLTTEAICAHQLCLDPPQPRVRTSCLLLR